MDDWDDFEIASLGSCKCKNPLTTANYVKDSDCILLDPRSQKDDNKQSSPLLLSSLASPGTMKSAVKIQLAGPREHIFFEAKCISIGMITCGGVCPGLNNVIRSIVNVAWYRYGVRIIRGYRYGFKGIAGNKCQSINLTPDAAKDFHKFGGTILGTSRGPQDPKVMADFLMQEKIDILFCIGGDGTMRGCHALATELKERNANVSVVGVGKTIDNDILFLDRSFGFETAVELSQQALQAAHEEARSTENGIGIVKLMGRESGAIALHASLASGDVNVLLVPEVPFTVPELISYLVERFKTRDHTLIVCAEGAGQTLMESSGRVDASGNPILPDVGDFLKKHIGGELKKLGITHSIKYIDPSYSIRAGVANSSDSALCTVYAQMAVHAAMCGKTDLMIGLLHGQFVHLPLKKVTAGRKNVDVKGTYWQAFLDATGSPFCK